MKCIACAGMLSIVVAAAPRAGAQELGYRLIHEEPLGGADSAVSPDGKWLAFSSRRGGNVDLWMVEVETGKLKQLTDADSRDFEPTWHPDGTHLVFTSDREDNPNHGADIFTIDLKTLEVTQETSTVGMADYPSYSKDGTEIVFTSGIFGRGGIREVWVKNLEAGKLRQVTKGHTFVGSSSFSPDGKQIAYHAYYDGYGSAKSDVWTVDSAGGKGTNITNTNDIWDYKPVWSYDGEWITFASKRGTKNFNVFIVHPDGTGLRAITNQNGPDFRWPNFTRDRRLAWHAIYPQAGRVEMVSVKTDEITNLLSSSSFIENLIPSPDGTKFLFEDRFRINVIDTAKPDARPTRLGSGREPRWSGDGKSIVYVSLRDKKTYKVAATGGNPVEVSERPPVVEASAWSPDRKTSAKVADGALVLLAQDGSSRKLADNGEAKSSPIWSPDGQYIFYCQNQPAAVRYFMTTKPEWDQ